VDIEDPAEDRVVFCTNRTDIDADNATNLLRDQSGKEHDRGYTNRWLVETGFQKIKDFLAFTKSSHSEIRLFYTLYATLLFDVWMTVDRTIKKREYELDEEIEQIGNDDDGPEYASEPKLSADVLSVIVATYLRPII
jgi:IS4 transposase